MSRTAIMSNGISSSGSSTVSLTAPPTASTAIPSTSTKTTTTAKSIPSTRRQMFLEIVEESNKACSNGDFRSAIRLYSRALKIDRNNHILYSNRSAAYIKMGRFTKALQDAVRARELNSKWSKAYYRHGVALQCLGKHGEALAAFSAGLVQDSKSSQLLSGLIEAALKSPLKGKLESTFRQLEGLKLDKCPFVIISVIGQELLGNGLTLSAVNVLENGLQIGTRNLRLKGSVLSALSSAYWALNSLDKAINYMQQDLGVSKTLGDIGGECRAHGNLGSAYFTQGNFKAALTSHRYQLVLAMKSKDTQATASALTSLGHVYMGIGDYTNALASYQQCIHLMKQVGDSLQEARGIGNVGSVYVVMGDVDSAIDCHVEHLRIAKELTNLVEEARSYSNLAMAYHYRRNFERAVTFHNEVLRIGTQLGDGSIEGRAYAGLGHAARCVNDLVGAKSWHEKQLEVALRTKDKVGEGRAISNLGMVYQLLGDQVSALKLHRAHLHLAVSLSDRSGIGRAYGNIGNAYHALGFHDDAIKYHKQELIISKEVNDRNSEAVTHGNLAVAYQALGDFEEALLHYHSHLNYSRELKDVSAEACALLNLGNCHSSAGDYGQAIPFYENYLMVSQELSDVEGEAKACHFLGFAHYCLGQFKEAVRYYDQDLSLAKELGNQENIATAYCNLGLAHLALASYDKALDCQSNFLTIAHTTKDIQCQFRALGNIGNVLVKMKRWDEAIKLYQKQLHLGTSNGSKNLEAGAYGSLGNVHRWKKEYEIALGYYSQELNVLLEFGDVEGQSRAFGNLGAAHMLLKNYRSAIKCYEEMLSRGKDLKNSLTEAQALGNLGIVRMNLGECEEAIVFLADQLKAIDRIGNRTPLNTIQQEKAHAYQNLGDCYSLLGRYNESLKSYDKAVQIFQSLQDTSQEAKTQRSMGLCQKNLGNYPEALKHFQRRVALLPIGEEVEGLRDLGCIYLELKQYKEAQEKFETQLLYYRQRGWKREEALTLDSLGESWVGLENWKEALRNHQLALRIAVEISSEADQCRSLEHLGFVHESTGTYEEALSSYDECLKSASRTGDNRARITAFSNIGRIHNLMGNNIQAIAYLKQGLQLVETAGSEPEEEAKINHFLGLSFWKQEDLESAEPHLRKSIEILERRRQTMAIEISLNLFDCEIVAYQSLQQILVCLGRRDEALTFAEKARTIPNVTLDRKTTSSTPPPIVLGTINEILAKVDRLRSAVLYFSLVGTVLHSWLIVPFQGIVKFNDCSLSRDEDEEDSRERRDMDSLLDAYLQGTHESLGLDTGLADQEESDLDFWSSPMQLEDLNEKLNSDNDKTGFLRMVNRNHRLNCSSYSLSSLFSTTGSIKSLRSDSTRSSRKRLKSGNGSGSWQGPSSLRSLYQMLIGPFEDELHILESACIRELILVVETPLLTVPFSLLRSCTTEDYLMEKFKLMLAPSISGIKDRTQLLIQNPTSLSSNQPLIVGNPEIHGTLRSQWGWTANPRAEAEASLVAHILRTEALTGVKAKKETVLFHLSKASVVHFSTFISWPLSAIVLGSNSPNLADHLITAAEILRLQLKAHLMVLNCSTDGSGIGEKRIPNGRNLIGLGKSLLAAGVTCLLISLWPVPEGASKLFYHTFYSALMEGSKVSHALSEGLTSLQQSSQFSHPANWAGYILLGSDTRVTRDFSLPGEAIMDLLKSPEKSKNALRVCLHLVEKSLQRIRNGQRNTMYTTQKSIETKVGPVTKWKDILSSVGFRFEPPSNGLPAAVFFPQSDPGELLIKCSTCLQALLGLPPQSIKALVKLVATPDIGDEVIAILRQAISAMTLKDWDSEKVRLKIAVKLWGIAGCHELLASLGFDLVEVSENEVRLGIGKNLTLRMLQLALQALLSIFESLGVDDYTGRLSLESLELKPEELVMQPEDKNVEQHGRRSISIGLTGKGAFTSYVRPRGEPDGHTNLSEGHTLMGQPTSSSDSARFNLDSIVNRSDSCTSSGSSAINWESNGMSTIRRLATPKTCPKISLPESKGSKRVSWKSGKEDPKIVKELMPTTQKLCHSDALLKSDVYQEQSFGLDIAPSLSKLLLSSRLNSNQADMGSSCRTAVGDDYGTDVEPGALSMDETLSNFDQLSLAEESAGEGNSTTRLRIRSKVRSKIKFTLPPVPMKRSSKLGEKTKSMNPDFRRNEFSIEESSSSNSNSSSKGSPSDLSKRDEADGRSLTDSQYGSYSPSMAMAQTQKEVKGQHLYFPDSQLGNIICRNGRWKKSTMEEDGDATHLRMKKFTKDGPIPLTSLTTPSTTFTNYSSSTNNQKSTEC